jgi:hypothetical protein
MANTGNKTVPTDVSPAAFVATVENAARRADAQKLLSWFGEVTGLEPVMWGTSIIGYGRYRYKYDSGREGEYMLTGFSPRKSAMTVYIMPGYQFPEMQDRLNQLGKHKLGKSCLYINKLADIDMQVLRKIVEGGVRYMRENYETWDR